MRKNKIKRPRRLIIRNLRGFRFSARYNRINRTPRRRTKNPNREGYINVRKPEAESGVTNEQYFVGPLNLNRATKQADTVMGRKLPLSDKEFEALDMLASHEGESLSFERLYKEVWNGRGKRETVLAALDNLINEVNLAGGEFMRAECNPEDGYRLTTRWGQAQWSKNPNSLENTKAVHAGNILAAPLRRKEVFKALMIGIAASAAAFVILAVSAAIGVTETDMGYVYIEDALIPFAAFPETDGSITFPGISEKITVYRGFEDMAIDLYNPESNSCYFVFRLIDAYTGRTIFTSEPTAPGTSVGTVVPDIPFTAGTHRTVMNIRAYRPDGVTVTKSADAEFIIIVLDADNTTS